MIKPQAGNIGIAAATEPPATPQRIILTFKYMGTSMFTSLFYIFKNNLVETSNFFAIIVSKKFIKAKSGIVNTEYRVKLSKFKPLSIPSSNIKTKIEIILKVFSSGTRRVIIKVIKPAVKIKISKLIIKITLISVMLILFIMKNIMKIYSERISPIIKPGIIFPIMIEKGERRVDIKTSMVLLFFSDNKDSEVR
jgi:hypothetical protein